MRRTALQLLGTALLLAGCAAEDRRAKTGDVATDGVEDETTTSTGTTDEVDEDLRTVLEDNNIVLLEVGEDGREHGIASTDIDGRVMFYSAEHEGLYLFDAADADLDVVSGIEVELELDEEHSRFFAIDPSNALMPLQVWGPAGGGGADTIELTVDGLDMLSTDGTYAGEVTEADPFGPPPPPFTIVGIQVNISISSAMRSVATAGVWMAFEYLVDQMCLVFDPLYEDRCDNIAKIATAVGQTAHAGLSLALNEEALASMTWNRAFWTVTEDAASTGIAETCKFGADYFLGGWLHPDASIDRQEDYRRTAYKYMYLQKKLAEEPPETAPTTEDEDMLVYLGDLIVHLQKMVNHQYFEVWNGAQPTAFLDSNTFKLSLAGAKKLVSVDIIRAELVSLTYGYSLSIFENADALIIEEFEYLVSKWDVSSTTVNPLEPLNTMWFDCGLAVATQANIKWTEDGVERDAAAELDVLVGDLQQTAETAADVYHRKFYGEAIPDPDCLPDLYEPNGTWEAALSRPLSYTADGSPVRVEDLNLCDGATADESDWYAFPSSLINFQTQARIRKPEGSPEGTDVPICMEIWFYDELLELGYLDPVQIASACGTVREEFSTAQLSVASTTGVRWQYLMVHVFPDPSAPAPTEGVDYILTFSE